MKVQIALPGVIKVEQVPDSTIIFGDMKIDASSGNIRMTRGVTHLCKRPSTRKRVTAKGVAPMVDRQVLLVELPSLGGSLTEAISTNDHPLRAQYLASSNKAISDTTTVKPSAEGVGVLGTDEGISTLSPLLLSFGLPSDQILLRTPVPP